MICLPIVCRTIYALILSGIVLIFCLLINNQTQTYAQDVKGASKTGLSSVSSSSTLGLGESKSGSQIGSVSKFREAIASVRQKQSEASYVKDQGVFRNSISSQKNSVSSLQVAVEQQQQQQLQVNSLKSKSQTNSDEQQAIAEPTIFGSIKGTPGVDFPAYTGIPNTKFSCSEVPITPGMYADESTNCQVYHLCHHGRKESFLCGIGTVFNQAILNCDFWHSVECSKSARYYQMNANFGQSSAEPDRKWTSSATKGITKQVFQASLNSFEHNRPLISVPLPTKTILQQKLTIGSQTTNFSGNSLMSNVEHQQLSSFDEKAGQSPEFGETFSKTNSDSKELPRASRQRDHRKQHQSLALISPGRRIALQNQLNYQFGANQLASESSTRMEILQKHGDFGQFKSKISSLIKTMEEDGIVSKQPGKRNGSAIVAETVVGSPTLTIVTNTQKINNQEQKFATKTSSSGQFSQLLDDYGKTNSTSKILLKDGQDDVWRPYFKSKTSFESRLKLSTLAPSPSTTTSEAEAPVVTLGQPNQEPTFSIDTTTSEPGATETSEQTTTNSSRSDATTKTEVSQAHQGYGGHAASPPPPTQFELMTDQSDGNNSSVSTVASTVDDSTSSPDFSSSTRQSSDLAELNNTEAQLASTSATTDTTVASTTSSVQMEDQTSQANEQSSGGQITTKSDEQTSNKLTTTSPVVTNQSGSTLDEANTTNTTTTTQSPVDLLTKNVDFAETTTSGPRTTAAGQVNSRGTQGGSTFANGGDSGSNSSIGSKKMKKKRRLTSKTTTNLDNTKDPMKRLQQKSRAHLSGSSVEYANA